MREPLLDLLRAQPVITLFLTLGLGYLLGSIRVVGVAFGAVTGTLLVSLVLGSYGFRISPAAQAVGFALFIFSVGYEAGPRFIAVLKTQGWRYLSLALVVAAIGFASAALVGRWLGLPAGGTAGLLSGALTSTPMLAAARESVSAGIADLPAGIDANGVIDTIGTTYAITYVVGMLGLIGVMRILPRIAGVDLASASPTAEDAATVSAPLLLQARSFRIADPELWRSSPLDLQRRFAEGLIVRIRRCGHWLTPQPHEALRIGDEIHAYGDAALLRIMARIGEEIEPAPVADFAETSRRVLLTQPRALGQTLGQLDLARTHGILVSRVQRDSLTLPLTADLRLQRGDILTVVGAAAALATLPSLVGPLEGDIAETDMKTFAFGIAIGTAIGLLTVTVAGIPVGVGTAGGLLFCGVAAGWANSVRPSIASFPEAARWILMEFGLLIFITGVGLGAGSHVLETLHAAGLALIFSALAVVTLPVVGGYLFGRHVLHLPPLALLGALTGAMTSGPALSLLTAETRSAAPVLGYTGTYAFACILMTLSGTLVMLL